MNRSYLDFDLQIERGQGGYDTKVLKSPAGEGRARFRLPFNDADLDDALSALVEPSYDYGYQSQDGEQLSPKSFGARLYEALFRDAVGNCFVRSLEVAKHQQQGLRIRLRLDHVPELAGLPWEYLYEPQGEHFLVLSPQTPIVRYLEMATSEQPLELARPLRILMVIANPEDYQQLDVAHESKKIEEALSDLQERGLVVIERLPQATPAELQKHLRRGEVHILHFIGHGVFDEESQRGALVFENAEGQGEIVLASVLSTLLRDHRSLRLALLNACEGARTAQSNPFAGTAQRLVQQGLPSVIAMQFPISDQAGITLTYEFYSALADGYAVDAALAEARKALHVQGNQTEWGTPVLFMRAPDGRLFEIEGVGEEAPAPGLSPYKGLEYFEENDAKRFFGREKLTAQLVAHLRKGRFLAVIGASGSGKSSLVRAGLIPALKRAEPLADKTLPPEGSHNWLVRVMTPTKEPLESLAASLVSDSESTTAQETLANDLAQSKRSLHLYARRLLSNSPPDSHLLLIVDQFEELFTLCLHKSKRQAFIDNLMTAVTSEGPTIVVITLRADFYSHCAQFEALRTLLAKKQEFIGPMNKEELRRAIEEPAKQGGWDFEAGLVPLLLKDVGNEPGALPLLSHALLEAWRRRRGRTLTFASYTSAGRIQGAIARTADRVYNQRLTPQQQAIARHIFLQLTELGEGAQDTRRRVLTSELIRQPFDVPTLEAVLLILANARLITTSADSVQVAHEALIREWPLLRKWLNENREGLRIHRQLSEDAKEWLDLKRDIGALYRGARLALAVEWAKTHLAQMSTLERQFIGASKELEEREKYEQKRQQKEALEQAQKLAREEKARRLAEEQRTKEAEARSRAEAERAEEAEARRQAEEQRAKEAEAREQAETQRAEEQTKGRRRLGRLAAVLAMMVVLALLAAGVAYMQQQIAGQQTRIATARQLAAQSQLMSNRYQKQRRLLLALEALDTTKDSGYLPAAEEALRDALTEIGGVGLAGHEEKINTVALSPSGHWLVTASADQTARLWDLTANNPQAVVLAGHQDEIKAVAISDHWLVSASADKTARLWDLRAANPAASSILLKGHNDSINAVAISPDNDWAVTGSFDKSARLWDLTLPNPASNSILLSHENLVTAVAFTNQWVVTAGQDKTARLWNLQKLADEPIILEGHAEAIGSLAISEQWLVTASGKSAYLWDLQKLEEPVPIPLEGHTQPINAVAISPDNHWLATASSDTTARLWDLMAGEPAAEPLVLQGHIWDVSAVAFSPDSKSLLTGSRDATAQLWDLTAQEPQTNPTVFKGHENWVNTVAISEQWLVTGSWDTTARLWDLTLKRASSHPLIVETQESWGKMNFSPSKAWLVTASEQNVLRLWKVTEPLAEPISLLGQEAEIIDIAISDRWLVTGGNDNIARLWDLKKPSQKARQLKGHSDWVRVVAISPNNRWLATGSDDTTALLWDLTNLDASPLSLAEHSDWITALAFSPDEQWLVTGSSSDDKTARLWDLTATDPSAKAIVLAGHKDEIKSLAFSPDQRWLVTVSAEETARLWDLTTVAENQIAPPSARGRQGDGASGRNDNDGISLPPLAPSPTRPLAIAPPLLLRGHEKDINAIAISPSGEWLVTASGDTTPRLWDLTAKDPSAAPIVLSGHERGITAVTISDEWLVTASPAPENAARLWDLTLEEPSEQSSIKFPAWNIQAVAISRPDKESEWLVTASQDGTIRHWTLRLDQLLQLACHTAGRNLSQEEWQQYFPEQEQAYHKTCANLPVHYSFVNTLIKEGQNLAKEGQLDAALAKIKEALALKDEQLERESVELENEAQKYVVTALVEKAKELAKEGDYDAAMSHFRQAQTLDSTLELESDSEIKTIAASALVQDGTELAKQGDLLKALPKFDTAQTLDPALKIEADSWHTLCRAGIQAGYAARVVDDACQQAVDMEPENGKYHESRGIARSLTGNLEGAKEDFDFYLEWLKKQQEDGD